MSTETQALFQKVFSNTEIETIPFNPKWSNGTGYFDHAVEGDEAPVLAPGRIVKSATPGGRKILIVGTPIGNVVIFQRYDDRDDIYVMNTTTLIMHLGWFESGRLDIRQMSIALGDYGDCLDNVGFKIKQINDACKKKTKSAEAA